MKVDFMKACDCVEHIFIWEIMAAMGFHEHLIKLAKGLVEKAESKVHVNGFFIEPIKLDQGVRQGCPFSSLLFVISTQPLMDLINEQVNLRELNGIKIDGGKQLTHQLFTDNIGFFMLAIERNFQCVKDIIAKYETISSASLNLTESIMIPMYLNGPVPPWLANVGCKIVALREVITWAIPSVMDSLKALRQSFLLGRCAKD